MPHRARASARGRRAACRCATGSASAGQPGARCTASTRRWSGSSVALLALGLVMVYSASVALPDNPKFARYAPTYFLTRHVLSHRRSAFVAALVAVQVPMSVWEKCAPWIFVVALLLLVIGAGAVHRQGRQRRAPLDSAGLHELPAVRAGQAGDRDVRRQLHGAQDGREGELLPRRDADGRGAWRWSACCCWPSPTWAPSSSSPRSRWASCSWAASTAACSSLITAVLIGAFVLMIAFSDLAARAHLRLPGPVEREVRAGQGLPADAFADRLRPRRDLRPGPRAQRREAALPARGAHRLPAGGDRRGARLRRRGRGDRAFFWLTRAHLPDRPPGDRARPRLRRADVPGHRHLDRLRRPSSTWA